MSVFMRGGSPFASSGASPWRNRDTSFGVNATAAAIRDAINTPSAWGYSAHNLLLNSATLSTQSVTVVSGNTYTVSFSGTGSIALSGAATATISGTGASARVFQTVTATTTTLTLTVTGSVTSAQLNVGPTALDYVATTSAARGPTTPGYAIPGFAGARINAAARTSVAMQQRVDGVWEFAPHNLLTQSAQFDNSVWLRTGSTTPGVTPNSKVSPDGTQTADTVTFYANSGTDRIYQDAATNAANGTAVTGSVWMWSDAPTTVRITVERAGPADSEFTTCSLTTTPTRFVCSHSSTWTGATALRIKISDKDGGGSIYVWGAQLNAGPAATTYVPTATQAVYAPAIDWLSGIGAYGLRSEAAATNLLTWSADMTNAAWVLNTSGVGVLPVRSSVASAAPDGGPASRFQFDCADTASATNRSLVSQSVTVVNGTTYTRSVWVKAFNAGAVGKTIRISSDLISSHVVTLSADWQRASLSGASTTTASNVIIECRGTVTTQTADVLLWCPQLETDSVATSPILTYGASATRAADTLTVPDTAAGFIGQTMGTLAVEAVPVVIGNNGTLAINSANSTNDIDLRTNTVAQVTVGGSLLMSPSITAATANALSKAALAYTLRSSAASRNGAAATLTGDAPAFTQVQIGGYDGSTTGNLNGHITRVRVTQDVLTPAALAAISA